MRVNILVALSTHPHKRAEADRHMASKIDHLQLKSVFDFVYTARPYPWGKGKVIESVLKKRKIKKTHALLVGDSYVYDYQSAKMVRVECILIRTESVKIKFLKRLMGRTITETNEIINHLIK